MKIEIKNRFNGNVIFAHECEENTIRKTLEAAIASGRANLCGANLSRAYLTGANLSRAYLCGANLSGADLSRAYLTGANLYGADLSGADLYGADLSGAKYGEATLELGFKQLLGMHWPIYFFDAHIKIGCKFYSTKEWRGFSNDEISEMDCNALTFWVENKEIILAIADHHQKEKQ